MKTSSIVFDGLLVIFLIFAILTAPLNMGLFEFVELVGLKMVFGLIAAFALSWIYKVVTHEDRKLTVSSSQLAPT